MLVFFFLWISLCSLAYFLVKSRFLCLIVHYYAEGSRLNGIRDDVKGVCVTSYFPSIFYNDGVVVLANLALVLEI